MIPNDESGNLGMVKELMDERKKMGNDFTLRSVSPHLNKNASHPQSLKTEKTKSYHIFNMTSISSRVSFLKNLNIQAVN